MDILDIDEALKDDSYMWVMHPCFCCCLCCCCCCCFCWLGTGTGTSMLKILMHGTFGYSYFFTDFWRIRPTMMSPTYCSSGNRIIRRSSCNCIHSCRTTTRVSLSTHTDADGRTDTRTLAVGPAVALSKKQIWVKLVAAAATTLTKFALYVGRRRYLPLLSAKWLWP